MLDEYLDRAALRAWRWGRMDCCCFAGDWIREATGRDPLARVRGSYSSARAARRLIDGAGGLLNLVDAEMRRCGFAETYAPEDGDIAVVALDSGGHAAVAGAAVVIRRGPWWIGKVLGGIGGFQAPVLRAWRVL